MKGSITAWVARSGPAFGFSFAPDTLGQSWGTSAALKEKEFLQASYVMYTQYAPKDAQGKNKNVVF